MSAIIRDSCALLFFLAGVHKLATRAEFAATLAGYRVLPAGLLPAASVLVPTLECLIAVGLLLPRLHEQVSLTGAALLALYAAAMGLNLIRGRRQLDCGCLNPRGRGRISSALVLRNISMALVLAAAGGVRVSGRPILWLDAGTVLAAMCAVALLYSAANGLLAVAAHRQPERG